jgi:periplasmic protein CpxP/Spy
MKKQMVLLLAFVITGATMTYAQQGGFRTPSVEERIQTVHQKIDSAFKPDAAKLTQIDSVFANYYRTTDKIRQDIFAASNGERPDMQVVREKMQPATEVRDKELKGLLGDDNFKKFKEEIEPSMRRGGRPPGGNRQQ